MHKNNDTPNHYRPDIDGLRAFAVLSVVGYHAFPGFFRGGFVGVDVFFVISGYLISKIIFAAMDGNKFSFIDFYSRRIKRIFPALLVVLLSCMLVGWWTLLAAEFELLGKHIAAGAGFISNLLLWQESGYFDSAAIQKPLLHLWSLGVEEQFYIVWPLIVWMAYRFKFKGYLRVNYVIVLIAGCSFALNVSRVNIDIVATFYSPQSRFWELLFGSILGWLTLNKKEYLFQSSHLTRELLSVSGCILLVMSLLFTTDQSLFPGWWALLPVSGTFLLVAAGPDAWVNRAVLSHPVIVWFGLISFPLYLWHWPLLSFAYIINNEIPPGLVRLGIVVISIVLAAFTYYAIEIHIRHANKHYLITMLLCLMVAVGATGILIYQQQGFPERAVVQANLQISDNISYRQNPSSKCTDANTYQVAHLLCVKYVAEDSKKDIVLWGDSSTGAWLPVFLDYAARNNISLFHIMHLSCPPILDVRKTRFNFEDSRKYCSDGKTQREILSLIKDLKPEAIVVIAAWNAFSEYSNREFITAESLGEANAQTTKHVMTEKLPETLIELSNIAKTIVFESWPMLTSAPNARKLTISGKDAKVASVKRNEFNLDVSSIQAVLNKVQRQVGEQNLVLFSPSKKICQQDECLSIVDGVNYYLDKYHITPRGSLEFAPDIERLLK